MREDRDKGIEALRQIYRYADQEKRIAESSWNRKNTTASGY